MSDYSSVLTFEDLIIEAARKLGVAYYGEAGDEQPQVPRNTHDLWLTKNVVNIAMRDFIRSSPRAGWRWLNQVQSLTLWPGVAVAAASTLTSGGYTPGVGSAPGTTIVNAATAVFYPSMEQRDLVLTGVGTFLITEYVSAQQVRVQGDASAIGVSPGVTWAITTTGAYTLPRTFSGQKSGDITYAAGDGNGQTIEWTDEASLRRRREVSDSEYGDPFYAAIRPMTTPLPRPRWELLVYPTPNAVRTVQFPFLLYFSKLDALTDVSPAPFTHDETLRAAVLAACEREEMGGPASDEAYYRKVCLPDSHLADARSAPSRIEANNRPMTLYEFRQNTQRQPVQFNT